MGAPSTQTVTQDVDPDIKNRMLANYSDATDYLNNTPYQPYLGQQVAGQQPWMDASQQYLSQKLFGQNLGASTPQTYGPFGYDPGQMTNNFPYSGGGDGREAQPRPEDAVGINPRSSQMADTGEWNPGTGATGWGPQTPTSGSGPINPQGLQAGPGPSPTGARTQDPNSGGQVDWMYAQGGPQAPPITGEQLAQPPSGSTGGNIWSGVFNQDNPEAWRKLRENAEANGYTQPGGPGTNYQPPGAPNGNWGDGRVQPIGPGTPATSGGTYENNGFQTVAEQANMAGQGGATNAMYYQNQTGAQGMGQYQNPWEQQVVQGALDDQARGEAMFREGGIYSKGAGTYGGDRQAVQVGEANRNFADRQGLLSAQLRSQGFNTAAANAQMDANRNLGAAGVNLAGSQALDDMGQRSLDQTMQIGGQAGKMGMYNQQQAQNMIDADMNQYDQARNDPLRRFGLLQGIASGIPVGMNQTTSSNPNMFSQIAGLVMGGAGAAGGMGWSPFGPGR